MKFAFVTAALAIMSLPASDARKPTLADLAGPEPYGGTHSSASAAIVASSSSSRKASPDALNLKRTNAHVLPRGYIVEYDSEEHARHALSIGKRDLQYEDSLHAHLSRRAKPIKYKKRYSFDTKLVDAVSIRLDSDDDVSELYTAPGVLDVHPIRQLSVAAYKPVKVSDDFVRAATGHKATDILDDVTGKILARANNDPRNDTFEPHVMTGVNKLHAEGHYGKGQTVAVIDTGVDYTHPALNGGLKAGHGCFGEPHCQITGGYDLVGDDYTGENDPSPDDDPFANCAGSGHGTHVTGTIIANDTTLGFTGVVPHAKVHMYRVFGCGEESTASDDVIMAAMQKAYFDGVDILSLSLGGPGGWIQSVSAAVASKISDLGTPVVIANGNDGANGMFYGSSPGVAKDGTAVGSVNNDKLTGYSISAVPDYGHGTFPLLNGQAFKFNSSATTYKVYVTANSTTTLDDACDPLPDDTPDLSDYIVVIGRGTCFFATKFQNVWDKGGRSVLVYNTPAPASITYVESDIPGQQAATLTRKDGLFIVKKFLAGKDISIDFSDVNSLTVPDKSGGGIMSSFSTYTPEYTMHYAPQISAPGGNILSTWPIALGSYTIISGTSMATPFTSGSYAMYRSIHGTKDSAVTLRGFFGTTADVVKVSTAKNETQLNTLAQQGPGLINVDRAVHSTTSVTPAMITTNDTAHFDGTTTLTFTNKGKKTQTYTLSHKWAGTAMSIDANSTLFNLFPVPLEDAHAHVTYSIPRTFTLKAGASKKVVVTIKPPTGLSAKKLPVYTGKIVATSKEDPTYGSLSVPYMGVAGTLSKIPVLDDNDAVLGINLPVLLTPSTNYTVKSGHTYSLDDEDSQPNLLFRVNFGTPLYEIDLVPANTTFKPTIKLAKDRGDTGPSGANRRSMIESALEGLLPRRSGHHGRASRSALKRRLDDVQELEARDDVLEERDDCEERAITKFGDVDITGMVYSERWVGRNAIDGVEADYSFLIQPIIGNLTNSHGVVFDVKDGDYRVLIRAQRVYTDETEEASYDSWLSQKFTVKRGKK